MWNRRLQLPRMQQTNSRRLTIISHFRVTCRSLSTTDSPILIWERSIPWESGWMHIIIGLSWYMDYFKEIFRKATSALQKKKLFRYIYSPTKELVIIYQGKATFWSVIIHVIPYSLRQHMTREKVEDCVLRLTFPASGIERCVINDNTTIIE